MGWRDADGAGGDGRPCPTRHALTGVTGGPRARLGRAPLRSGRSKVNRIAVDHYLEGYGDLSVVVDRLRDPGDWQFERNQGGPAWASWYGSGRAWRGNGGASPAGPDPILTAPDRLTGTRYFGSALGGGLGELRQPDLRDDGAPTR